LCEKHQNDRYNSKICKINNTFNCGIIGDLNLSKLFQHSGTKDLITNSFEICFSTLCMFHMNKAPTKKENCLDRYLFVHSTYELLLFDITSADPFCNSDHNSVLFKISVSSFKEDQILTNFRKADYDA